MEKITVIGSSYFERYLEHIRSSGTFPHVELSYFPDRGGSDFIDVNAVIDKIDREGIQALVLGPLDYERLAPHVGIPCYVVHPSLQDFLLLHNKIGSYEDTAVIFSYKDDMDFSILENCLNVRYNKYYYRNFTELGKLIRHLQQSGYRKVISNNSGVTLAKSIGLESYYYFSEKCIEDGISNALQLIRNLERENHYITEIRTILENTTCGVIYTAGVDTRINYVNKTALEILHCQRDSLAQRPLAEFFSYKIIERLRRKSEPEVGVQFTVCNTDVIGNMIPLKIQNNETSICLMFEKTSRILEYETMIRQESKRKNFSTRYTFSNIIGTSPALMKAIENAKRFAISNSTILINAETGTGKELFAQSIHNHSPRHSFPFVAINCASIPDTLIESELFGHMPNSFTGASSKGKSGLIELANHGTVFLDDVDILSHSFQSKLLRVMQEREIIRIGGNSSIPIDVRFIVATNRDLRKMVKEGTFRNDLFFRINILHLNIPPLRERPDDISALYEHYLNVFDSALYQHIKPLFRHVFAPAFNYSYPGNVRELVSVVERFVALADRQRTGDEQYLLALVKECLDAEDLTKNPSNLLSLPISGIYTQDVSQAENAIFEYYCQESSCTMAELAKKLGMSRATLYNKMRAKETPT